MAHESTAPSYPIPAASGLVGPAGTDLMAKFMGYSVGENAGTPAAAKVRFRAGSLTGPVIAVSHVAASSSDTRWFGPCGIRAEGGIYVELVSGTVEGSVMIG